MRKPQYLAELASVSSHAGPPGTYLQAPCTCNGAIQLSGPSRPAYLIGGIAICRARLAPRAAIGVARGAWCVVPRCRK